MRGKMVDGSPFRFQFEKGFFLLSEIFHKMPVEIESPVECETVREFPCSEPENMCCFPINCFFHLGKNEINTLRYFYIRRIKIGLHDAVRTGEGASLDKVDCFISATYVMFCTRTIPHNT